MGRHFWHGITTAAILLLSAVMLPDSAGSASETTPAQSRIMQPSIANGQTDLKIPAPVLSPRPLHRLVQVQAQTTRDVERQRAEKTKKKRRKARTRRSSRKTKPVNAPPPAKKPDAENLAKGPGVSLAAALTKGGRVLTSGVVWTVEPLSGEAPPIVTTESQPTLQIPAGGYRITAKLKDFLQSVEVDIPEKGIARLDLAFSAARLKVKVLPAEGAMPLENARIRILKLGRDGAPPVIDTNTTAFDDVLPAGIYRVEAAHGLARASEDIGLTAGADRTVELNLSVGYVRLRARPAAGREFLPEVVFELLPADGLDAVPTPLATMSGSQAVFIVPAGIYRVLARYGEASSRQVVDIAANTFSDVVLDLEAGQAVITIDNLPQGSGAAATFRLTRHDGAGGASLFLSRTGKKLDVGLPVGSYTVTAELEDGRRVEKPFIIEPGVRTTMKLPLPPEPATRLKLTVGLTGGDNLPEGYRDRGLSYRITKSGDSNALISGNFADGQTVSLNKGRYEVVVVHAATGVEAASQLTVSAGSEAELRLAFPLGTASLALAAGTPVSGPSWVLTGIDGKEVARHNGANTVLTLRPGEYVVSLTVGETAHTAALSIAEGKDTPVVLPAK